MDRQIYDIFRQIVRADEEIRLLNVYKGVPISYEATIVNANPLSVRVKTSKFQFVCLYRERETYIQNFRFPRVLKAQVTETDLSDMSALLTGFLYIESGIGDRQDVRVTPEDPVLSDIRTPGMVYSFRGELADVSRSGLAIYVPSFRYFPALFRIGAGITVTLQLPGTYEITSYKTESSISTGPLADRFSRESLRSHTAPLGRSQDSSVSVRQVPFPELKINGVIVHTWEEYATGRHRIGIRILPNDPSKSVISRFISQRQSEIVREIHEVYNLIAREKGSR